jgi:hypothetical protein
VANSKDKQTQRNRPAFFYCFHPLFKQTAGSQGNGYVGCAAPDNPIHYFQQTLMD